jgi:uncharacterized protein YodC (DUF2158 family)
MTDPEALEPGDLVRLKSGGPTMTLGRPSAEGFWAVCWFAGDELKTASLAAETLAPAAHSAPRPVVSLWEEHGGSAASPEGLRPVDHRD